MLELGLIGLGGWGKRIVNSVQGKSDNVRIHSAIVSRPERYSDFAAQHDLDVGNDMARMLANPAIQGVISCGPAFLHAEHSLAALRAGKPVLAIKPMAKSAADAVQLQAAAEKSGVLLALGMTAISSPMLRKCANVCNQAYWASCCMPRAISASTAMALSARMTGRPTRNT